MIPESVIRIGEQPNSTSDESPEREKEPASYGSKKRPVIRKAGKGINDVKIEMDMKGFYGVTKLLEEIFSHVFGFCTSLHEIHLKHKEPIDYFGAFSSFCIDVSKITIYVPKGSSEAYRNSKHYKDFKEIIEEE